MSRRNILGLVIDHVGHVVTEREKIGILSLSDSPDNMLLWAHNGHEHRGVVLKIDISEMITERSDPLAVQALVEVKYSDKSIDYIAEKMPLWLTLMFKSSAWAYERERRLFKSLTELHHKGNEIYVSDLPPSAIKRVIFGARASGSDEEAAIQLIQTSTAHKHIEIQKAVFSSGLEFKTGAQFASMLLHGQHHLGENWRELRQWVDLSKMERAEAGDGLPKSD